MAEDHNQIVKEEKENRMLWDEPYFGYDNDSGHTKTLHMPEYRYPQTRPKKFYVDIVLKEIEAKIHNIKLNPGDQLKLL